MIFQRCAECFPICGSSKAPVLRLNLRKEGQVITDNGNFVMDVDFGAIEGPKGLAAQMCGIPGVVEHGIFDNLDEPYLARKWG